MKPAIEIIAASLMRYDKPPFATGKITDFSHIDSENQFIAIRVGELGDTVRMQIIYQTSQNLGFSTERGYTAMWVAVQDVRTTLNADKYLPENLKAAANEFLKTLK